MSVNAPSVPRRLSALTVFGEQRSRAERCLRHLLAQTLLPKMEIVVADIAPQAGPLAGADHPAVKVFPLPPSVTFGEARAECVRRATGEVLAFVEDHTYPDPGWAEAVVRAFEQPAAIVNYAVGNANPERYVCRAFLMAEYGRWMHPARSGWIPISACNNVAYRRQALEPYRENLDFYLESEYVLHRRMQSTGARVWLADDARILHENWVRLSDGLRANNAMKRLLAASRAEDQAWSLPRRFFYAAGMPLTPLLHVARLVRSLSARPALWPLFWTSLPVIAAVNISSAWAEALGYLFGEGNSREVVRATEVSVGRWD